MLYQHDIDPVMFQLGELTLYWYSFFLSLGVVLCYLLLRLVYRREGIPQRELESLMVYAIVGMFIGARLGHAFFYQPDYYLAHPAEVVKFWIPGLSSHGGAIGVLAAVFIWSRIRQRQFLGLMSLLSLGLPLILASARIGNFINSEAVGIPTGKDWGVVFLRLGEIFPRHPTQLYEALLAITIFFIVYRVYLHLHHATKHGTLLFLFGLLYFSGRFFLEFWKPHGGPESTGVLSLPQILSVPPIFVALCYFVWTGITKTDR